MFVKLKTQEVYVRPEFSFLIKDRLYNMVFGILYFCFC